MLIILTYYYMIYMIIMELEEIVLGMKGD